MPASAREIVHLQHKRPIGTFFGKQEERCGVSFCHLGRSGQWASTRRFRHLFLPDSDLGISVNEEDGRAQIGNKELSLH